MPFSCRSQRQILLRAAALLQAFRPLAANDGSAPIPAALPRTMRGWAAGETWFMLPAGDRSKKRPPVAGGSVF